MPHMESGDISEGASGPWNAPGWLSLAEARSEPEVRRALERLANELGHTCTFWSRTPEGAWSASGPASGTAPQALEGVEASGRVEPEGDGWLFSLGLQRVVELRPKHRPGPAHALWTLAAHARVAAERADAFEQLRQLTTVDEATGLHNARHLYEVLRTELARCLRHRRPLTILFVDLDRFKAINDQLGHLAGTRVLSDVGRILKDNLRRSDQAFRYGGDEYVVCLTDTPKEVAVHVVERLQDAFAEHARGFDDARRELSASIGVAAFPEDGDDPESLLGAADRAMYRAKRAGAHPSTGDLTVDVHQVPVPESPSLADVRPRVVLWDVMSTLVTEPFEVAVPAFFDMTLEELFAAKDPAAWIEFEYGRIDEEEYCQRFFVDRRPVDREAFKAAMRAHYDWMPGVEALLEELRSFGVPMYALSNYSPWYRMIEDKLGLSRYLRWDFVSCRTGYRKPSPEAYTQVLEQLGVEAKDCVFVDDRAKNVAAADAVGMVGILRRPDEASLRAALRDVGLLVKPGPTGDLPGS